ncbi:MAG: DUF2189 domain-containing protein [Xanthomonadales bacterium]|nr:DUF2189 domain-containing protein [Xanthomonadales bacterium]
MTQREGKADGDCNEGDTRPFVAPCRQLAPAEPLQWLRAGWKDYRTAAGLSLAWGLFCFFLSAIVTWAAWVAGGWILLLSVLSGFIFVGPLLAFALYSVSRQLCLGRRPSLFQTLRAARKPFANALVFALVLLVIFLLWARAGSMVHIFFPSEGTIRMEGLVIYLAVGSAVGSLFAAICFAASVFSLPFIANRDVDVVTAVVSSINAVLRNPGTMSIWALCVVSLTAVGFATAMLGFILIIPLLGYATWHAYRATLEVTDWPTLPLTKMEES